MQGTELADVVSQKHGFSSLESLGASEAQAGAAQWACITLRKPRPAGKCAQHLKRHVCITVFHSIKACLLLWKETAGLSSKDILYRNVLRKSTEQKALVLLLTRCAEMQDTHRTLLSGKRFTGKS